jgi:FlaA1/EpsC-like NDP-sugar epimerase
MKFKRTARRRMFFYLIIDSIILSLCMYGAFLIRLWEEEYALPRYMENIWLYIGLALLVKLPTFHVHRFYNISWSYFSLEEFVSILRGVSFSSLILGTLFFLLKTSPPFVGFPRSVLFIDYFLTLFLISGFRGSKRMYLQIIKKRPLEGEKTLIVGAGDAGEEVVRGMFSSGDYLPVGFVDDDPGKIGATIHGIKVLGKREEIPKLVEEYGVESILIAMPSLPSKIIRESVELSRKAGIKKIKIIPSLREIIAGKVALADVREVRLEDLLGREPIEIDAKEIENYIKEKRVLVTGAGGSIGSELCRQILNFNPKALIMLERDETFLFLIYEELEDAPIEIIPIVGDVKDESKIERIFSEHKPEVVFHAAAYKHVPIMEDHPDEAVKNNIFGTLVLGKASVEYGAEKFVLISTDKAVNPTSVMGATKRVAEMVIQDLNKRGPTRFVAVRFGNVLGSRGSVIPVFEEQIKKGGPVKVTHPDMKRYFMVTSESILLVLQAGAMGEGGEVFILDMGEPVRIVDLAREMIRLSGYEPDKDIPIVYTEPRPGEKLFEDILTAEEGTAATKHEKIFKVRMDSPFTEEELSDHLKRLKELAESSAKEEIQRLLQKIVPNYRPQKISKNKYGY